MTAKKTAPTLGDNLSMDLQDENKFLSEELEKAMARIEALTREPNTPLVNKPTPGAKPLFARITIILEENEHIPPSGQFFGYHTNWVNPETLLALEPRVANNELTRKEAQVMATEAIQFEAHLRPGEEAAVPVELLSVLNDALTDAPIVDPITSQVLGYRSRLRYPYRIVSSAYAPA